MTRLYLVCGLAEVWTCAALRQALAVDGGDDIVVVYGLQISMPDRLRRDTLTLARAFFPWTRVVDAVPLTPDLANPAGRSVAQKALRSLVGADETSVVFTHTLHKPAEQAILAAYPGAEIVLFDNGLASHLGPQGKDQAPPAMLTRVKAAYFSLLGDLPLPTYLGNITCKEIQSTFLLGAAETAFRTQPSAFVQKRDRPSVLILGTSFYRTPHISFETERSVYTSLLDTLRQRGLGSAVYKEHPRADRRPLLESSNDVELLDSNMPVELLPLSRPIEAVYSISSTALLTMRKLYEIPGHTIGRNLPLAEKLPQVRLAHAAVPS